MQVDGDWILTPKTYRWLSGSTHTLRAPTETQVFSQAHLAIKSPMPILYANGQWASSPGKDTITIKVPANTSQKFTYTAKFQHSQFPPSTPH